jgi:hypothetical protein
MAPPSRSSASRRPRGDTGKLVLGLLILLGLIASVFLIFSDSLQLVRIGLVAALWAAVIGALAATRYRRESAEGQAKARDLQKVYQLQLEREISARREFEHGVESRVREEVGAESAELAALRAELTVLRENLQRLFDGVQMDHRPALHADAFRVQELTSASSANDNHTETDWDPWNAPPLSPLSMTPIFEPDHPEPPAFATPYDDPVTAETSIVPPEPVEPEVPADPHPSDISFAAFLDSHSTETFASFDAYRSGAFDPFDPLGYDTPRPPVRRPEGFGRPEERDEPRWGESAADDTSRNTTWPGGTRPGADRSHEGTDRSRDGSGWSADPARDGGRSGDASRLPAWAEETTRGNGPTGEDEARPADTEVPQQDPGTSWNDGPAWDDRIRPTEAPRRGAIWDRGATREPSVAPGTPTGDDPARPGGAPADSGREQPPTAADRQDPRERPAESAGSRQDVREQSGPWGNRPEQSGSREQPAPWPDPPVQPDAQEQPTAGAWQDLREQPATPPPAAAHPADPGTPIGTAGARRRRRAAEDSTHRLSVAEIMANLRSEQGGDAQR